MDATACKWQCAYILSQLQLFVVKFPNLFGRTHISFSSFLETKN
jgi:hypothetical protein